MERRRARVFKGDWIQLVTTAPPPPPSSESAPPPPPPAAAATSFVLKPPAQHGDPVALAPLADSEFAAVSLVPAAPAAAAEAEAALASSDVVTVQLAGGFLAWWAAPAPIADAAAQPQRQPQPRALLWVDEDEVAEAERASFRPCRFRVESKEEEEGAGSSSSSSAFCVGASLVLVPEAADGGPESDAAAVLCAVASEDPDGTDARSID